MNPPADRPQVLIPFDLAEALTIQQAANVAGRSVVTLRTWAALHDLGRPVAARWMISRVALAMFLDGDREALRAYLAGDRSSALVIGYFQRFALATKKVQPKHESFENLESLERTALASANGS